MYSFLLYMCSLSPVTTEYWQSTKGSHFSHEEMCTRNSYMHIQYKSCKQCIFVFHGFGNACTYYCYLSELWMHVCICDGYLNKVSSFKMFAVIYTDINLWFPIPCNVSTSVVKNVSCLIGNLKQVMLCSEVKLWFAAYCTQLYGLVV